MCIYGALNFVSGGDAFSTTTEADAALDNLKPFVASDPVDWNNRVAKNQGEVIDLLRRAAAQ